MAGRYKAYSEYKRSNHEWLGDVPSHWDVVYSKWLFNERNDKANQFDEMLTASQKYGVIPQEVFMQLEQQKVVQVQKGHDILKQVKRNDFVISMRSFQGGIEFCEYNGAVSSAYVPLEPKTELNLSYFKYLFKSKPYIQALQATTNLVRDGQALRYNNFLQVKLPVPQHNEAEKIGSFLDHETAKIDTLIAKQEKLIELLKEKRQAVISHAVTKGLNPQAPMKDSGVEWLGEVPEHWRVVKLSYFLKLISGDGITSNQIESEGKYPVMGGNGLRGYTSDYNCDGDYALIGRQGALCGNINIANGKFFASEHAVVVYPYINFNLTFLSEFLRFMNLGQYSVSAAQPGISVERINGLKIAIPPLDEQTHIGDSIEKIINTFDSLANKAKTMIDVLKERKTALISAAVTGKIDVRDLEPQGVQG
ncbi:restriction endonuclease subunit S [Vibrio navarrensis]|uniref:restriction endonuclease subunit S n=1 Tax=Vibrio navarrensis TaxID=29495 RepID=UPI001867C913|nr:restriction endonuclease subunit S [Vibrio navarrensis]MBE3654211.1 hypothetical protein [Vibrio navarrensis]